MNFGRSARAALRDWQDTIAAARLCEAGGACHNPPRRSTPCTSLRLILTLSLAATVGLGIGRFAYALVLPSYGGQVALPTLQFAAQFPLNELYPWSSQ
jgi:hypothetical protein